MITQQYNLNLIPDKVPVQVNCSQFDSLSRTIEMTIYDGTVMFDIPSGTTASVRGTKADNTGFEYPCTISGSVVSFDIQPQMTVFSGRVSCEVRLINNGILGTCNFNLYVEPTPLDPNVTISETDLPLLEEAEQNAIRAEEAADEAESLLSTVVKSVNNTFPDASGNVTVQTSSPLSAGTGIDISNDVVSNTAPIWHGNEVGDLPVPINADQLQGHSASYFQQALTAGNGVTISNNTISVHSESVSITAGDVASSNLSARREGGVLVLNGYIVAKAQTYTNDVTVLFTVGSLPSSNKYFMFFNYTSSGNLVYVAKVKSDGTAVFNNTITFNATTYLFFNAVIPL